MHVFGVPRRQGTERALIIIPGLSDSGEGHWQTIWECRFVGSSRVAQDDWDTPTLECWLARLVEHLAGRPDAILAGHSLGALLIAHLAERYPRLPVAGALLVAPADTEAPTSAGRALRARTGGSFSPLPLSHFSFPAVLAASRNDPYLALPRAQMLARLWGAHFVDLGNAGHVNVASGHGPWLDGLALLEQVHELAAQRARPPAANQRPADVQAICPKYSLAAARI